MPKFGLKEVIAVPENIPATNFEYYADGITVTYQLSLKLKLSGEDIWTIFCYKSISSSTLPTRVPWAWTVDNACP